MDTAQNSSLEKKKIKVLIVDDSAVARKMLSQQLEQDEEIEVVGTAADPFIARDKICYLQPQVLTLDLEMPRMDGLSFLKQLMKYYPLPVIIISAYTPRGCRTALAALQAGAVDVLSKPGNNYDINALGRDLIEKVKMAATIHFPNPGANPETQRRLLSSAVSASETQRRSLAVYAPALETQKRARMLPAGAEAVQLVIAIGSSVGGPEALTQVLSTLPLTTPPILVVQHMPAPFTRTFAERLNEQCEMDVKEAEDGDSPRAGQIFIAPGSDHLILKKVGTQYSIRLERGNEGDLHRPSVDVLFRSVAKAAGANAVGVILTGMGSDGADGLLEMKKAGALTIAQDQKSCVVFGMPKEAIARGCIDRVVSLEQVSEEISKMVQIIAKASELK